MTPPSSTLHPHMPALAPHAMPTQDLSKPFEDGSIRAPTPALGSRKWRLATFLPAIGMTCVLLVILADWFDTDGFMAGEIALMAMVGFSAFWIALSVAASAIGLVAPRRQPAADRASSLNALDVAVLMPVYQEDPQSVFARITAMRNALSSRQSEHRFALFILSDTRDADIAREEEARFARLNSNDRSSIPVFYRRRENNIERKTGNIRDWIRHWGNAWDAFITLDADSLMSARTMNRLADEMAAKPGSGLIQTVPQLLGGSTLFARIQQFSNNIYGGVLARGLDRWSGRDGNYWGHNAIVRTRAFAKCCGLPMLKGAGPLGGTIKSHDFVEAALLRRAGWSVHLLPDVEESYEEIPQTIIDYVLRDRRWCQGNLQHLRLLTTKGLTAASRFHMLQGAMAYVSSVVWFALLVVWTLMGRSEEENVFRYFTDANPLFPMWPEVDAVSRIAVLAVMFGLLLLPKLFGIIAIYQRDPTLETQGGVGQFAISAFSEILLSFLLAPIMMVQHVVAVARTVLGRDAGWAPQNRAGAQYGIGTLLRFHWLETVIGVLLAAGLMMGIVSLWLLPIAISLACAVPISYILGLEIAPGSTLIALMSTRENWAPSRIIAMAQQAGHPLGVIMDHGRITPLKKVVRRL